MNKKELERYAKDHGFNSPSDLAVAILYRAAEADDLHDELADTKRRLDLAVLKEREAKAELAKVTQVADVVRSDEDQVDAVLNELMEATAQAVIEGRSAMDGRRAGVRWTLT